MPVSNAIGWILALSARTLNSYDDEDMKTRSASAHGDGKASKMTVRSWNP